MTANEIGGLDVSRETFERLQTYEALIRKWNPAINLVAKSTLAELWSRHIEDSAQIGTYLAPEIRIWADFGSGGGLPGIVLAILALERSPNTAFHLVESDQRKATFLRQAAQTLGLKVQVHTQRVEVLAPLGADVVSARALASLRMLCGFAARHLAPTGFAIFPKGANFVDEVEDARQEWNFDLDERVSLTHSDARLLRVKSIHHV